MVARTIFMPRPKKPPTTHVRMRKEMADQLSLIAHQRGVDIADIMQSLFATAVQSEYVKMIDDLAKVRKQLVEDKKK